jgi:hypothetical protein
VVVQAGGQAARRVPGGGAVYFEGVGGKVYRLPLPNGVGGSSPPLFVNRQANGLVADDNYVYFTDNTASNGAVERCPHGASCAAPEAIASGVGTFGVMTQDAVSIYWTASGPKILRLAK